MLVYIKQSLTQMKSTLTGNLQEICIMNEVNKKTGSTSFPVAQVVEHGASNAKIMGLIPRESKS